MRTKNFIFSVLALLFCSSVAFAQVSGVVVDDLGPVAGAVITVEQTGATTEADDKGAFSIDAKIGDELNVINPTTLAEKKVKVFKTNLGTVTISDASVELDDVITLGYNTTTDESFTGTADVVDAEAIEKKNVSNITQALAGESAGVRVITTTGQPGEAAEIRIRGLGSVNGNTTPLYVIDGIPMGGVSFDNEPYNAALSSINPGDIESMVILKDASATAIYGARGANGVVVINTKKGRSGKTQISYEGKTGFNLSLLPRYETISSPEEYMEIGWDGLRNFGLLNGIDESSVGVWASTNLFGDYGVEPNYNMWNQSGADLIDPDTGKFLSGVTRKYNPEDWEDYAFQPAIRQEHNLRFSGGNDKTKYYTSFGYLTDKGYSVKSDYERISMRLNLNQEVTEWMDLGVNVGYAYSDKNANGQSEDSGSIFWFVDNIPSIYPLFLRDGDGNMVADPIYGGFQYDYGAQTGNGRGFGAFTNAIADAHYNLQNTKQHDINTNIKLNIDFTDWLSFETKFGSQYYNSNYNSISNPYYGGSASQNGSLFRLNEEQFSYNFLQMFRFNKTLLDSHNFEFLVAHESNALEFRRMSASKSYLILPELAEFNNAVVNNGVGSYALEYSLESYFAQLNYNFAKKYFLTATARRDGTSRFINQKWGNFGSVGASWLLSKESFMEEQSIFSMLKLKTSYGLMGEQAGLGYYSGYNLYDVNNLDGEPGYVLYRVGNPDLTWETSKMFQVGAEMRLFDRVSVNLDYYNKFTTDLMFEKRIATSVGFAIQRVNDGEMLNSGFEFDVSADLIDTDDFYVNFKVNGEMMNNELKKMPYDESLGGEKILDVQSYYGRSAGHSIYDFYMREWAGVDPDNGAALWNLYYVDADGNGNYDSGTDTAISSMTDYLATNPNAVISQTTTTTYSSATQKYVNKSAIPDLRGAFSLTTEYKNLSFSVQFLYSIGGYAYDGAYAQLMRNGQVGGNNWHVDMRDRWQQAGDITDIPRLSNNYSADRNVASTSTRFLTKADYLTLNNIRIGYSIPSRMLRNLAVSGINIYMSGDNLWLLSKRKGFNPTTDVAGSSDTYRYSPLSTITFGLKVNL